jgi:HK97 family phage major capsid protein
MEAHKVGRICKVSEELLMDNQYSLENWLTATFAETNGLAMEKAYFRGDGANKPRGFLLDADVVDATGAGAVLSYNHLLELFAALKENYYLNATWLLNRKTLIKIMALKDDAGGYIYRPFETRTETAPLGSILGRPVAISELMEDVAPGKKPVAFGDFRRYRIHDRVGFTIQRLNEKYADTGFIGFRGMQRTDGKLLIPEAIKVLQFAGE